MKKRCFVLGIDGVPYTVLKYLFSENVMPFFSSLCTEDNFVQMNSIYPVISSAAWTSFATGTDPGTHGITGFVDVQNNALTIPLSCDIQCKTLFSHFSECGKHVISINVPLTTPPYSINGIMVSGFLSTDVEQAVFPRDIAAELKREKYIIDADPLHARNHPEMFLDEIFQATETRKNLCLRWMEKHDWDYMQLHIMGTDRINHFFFDAIDNKEHIYHKKVFEYYSAVDTVIKEIYEQLNKTDDLIILSDHGFEKRRVTIDVNYYLKEFGFFNMKSSDNRTFENISSSTKAFSLTPGRVYVKDPTIIDELIQKLKAVTIDDTVIFKKIYRKDELYQNINESALWEKIPELIIIPSSGVELRASFAPQKPVIADKIVGIHTYDDAFFYIKDHSIINEKFNIMSVYPTICELMNIAPLSQCKSHSIIKERLY